MRNVLSGLLIFCLMTSVCLFGCAKKTASSQDAIKTSETMKTVEEKVNYLVGQAKSFFNSQDYQNAIETAQHILSNLDQNSQEAQKIITDARQKIENTAKQAVADVTKKFGIDK